jgi:uncharacterized protein YndB with AHSA1/START domain
MARPEVVWETITDPRKYEEWSLVFSEGSYFDGGWNQGDAIRFLTIDSDGKLEGMVSEIAESRYPTFISIRHLGYIMDGIVDTESETIKAWAPSYENYTLDSIDEGQTKFTVNMDTEEGYTEMFEELWPKALEQVKKISEETQSKPMRITIRTFIHRPIESVWKGFTQSEHITAWNYASDDWHCPEAVNHLIDGGTFDYTMASRDGKVSFHFEGTYTKIVPHEQICYVLGDGRAVSVTFNSIDSGIAVEETFDAEGFHTYLQQRQGWQSILENFAAYVEKHL